VLNALLGPLCVAAPLNALRIDGAAGKALFGSSLGCLSAFLGGSLRQLALLDMQEVPLSALLHLVRSLPLLQASHGLCLQYSDTSRYSCSKLSL